MADPKRTFRSVFDFAMGLPGAWEDHPWDETVVKVGTKVFVFLGRPGSDSPGMSVKLRESHEVGMGIPGAAPTGYGLGRAGWVSVPFSSKGAPVGVLTDLVEESYRIVAPRRLVTELDDSDA